MAKAAKRSKPTRSLKSKADIRNWSNTDLIDYIENKGGIVLSPRNIIVLKEDIFGINRSIINREQILKRAAELYECMPA